MNPTSSPQPPVPPTAPNPSQMPGYPAPMPTPPVRRGPSKVLIGVLLVVLAAGLAAAYWYVTQGAKDAGKESNKTPTSANAFAKYQANVPDWLLEHNRGDGSVTLGYLKSTKSTSSRGGLVPAASAADAEYTSVLMYGANSQSDGVQIYSYNPEDKTKTQVTKQAGGASSPVFASVTQTLAYKMSPTTVGNGGITVKNLTTAVETVVVPTKTNVANVPLAWSPDGTTLAYASTNNDTAAADWGMLKLNLYTIGKTSVAVAVPAGFNSLASYADVVWVDNAKLQVRFIQKGALGKTEKTQVFSVNTQDQTAVAAQSVLEGELANYQVLGEVLYFLAGDPAVLKYVSQKSEAAASAVAGIEGIKSFALRQNAQAELSGLVYTVGEPGTLGAVKLFEAGPDGSKPVQLMELPGYGGSLLGWGQSFDEVLYYVELSGKRELHMYNLKTKADTVLLDNLPLVI